MGMDYTIKKEVMDKQSIIQGKFGWDFSKLVREYNIEVVNYHYDNCETRKRDGRCILCSCDEDNWHKIPKSILDKLDKENYYYEMIEELFSKTDKDYIWISMSC